MQPLMGPWEQAYVFLSLRLDVHVQALGAGWFVDCYMGPPAWAEAARADAWSPSALLDEALRLGETLAAQGFERDRSDYLQQQLVAIEAVCRKLKGEALTLEDEVRRCFGITPSRLPEGRVAEAQAMIDQAVPGAGPPRERLEAWRRAREVSLAQRPLLETALAKALAEARARTRALLALPETEAVALEVVTGVSYGAANWFLGGGRSRMVFNLDLPLPLGTMLDLVCHEGYPGHHAEYALKEHHLLVGRGHGERCVYPVLTPQLVISEGLATLASELVFAPGEREAWLSEHVYPLFGLPPESADLALLNRASVLFDGVRSNAVFLLEEGRPEAEVVGYLIDQAWMPEERARKFVAHLRTPLMAAYAFTYHAGAELLRPWLFGPGGREALARVMCEPLTPSALAAPPERTAV